MNNAKRRYDGVYFSGGRSTAAFLLNQTYLLKFLFSNNWHPVERQRQSEKGEPGIYKSIDGCYSEIKKVGFEPAGLKLFKG